MKIFLKIFLAIAAIASFSVAVFSLVYFYTFGDYYWLARGFLLFALPLVADRYLNRKRESYS